MAGPRTYVWEFGPSGVRSIAGPWTIPDHIAFSSETFQDRMRIGESVEEYVTRMRAKLNEAAERFPWAIRPEVQVFVTLVNLRIHRRLEEVRARLERNTYYACLAGSSQYLRDRSGIVIDLDRLELILEWEYEISLSPVQIPEDYPIYIPPEHSNPGNGNPTPEPQEAYVMKGRKVQLQEHETPSQMNQKKIKVEEYHHSPNPPSSPIGEDAPVDTEEEPEEVPTSEEEDDTVGASDTEVIVISSDEELSDSDQDDGGEVPNDEDYDPSGDA